MEVALLLVPFVIVQVATDSRRIRQLADVWLVGIAVGSLVGVAAYLGLVHLPSLVAGGPNVAVTRIKGLTEHPNAFGLTAAMVLPIAAVLYGLAAGRQRVYYGAVLAVLAVAILISGSRTAVLGGAFGLCVLAALDPVSRVALRRVALGVITVALVGGVTTFAGLPAVSRLLGNSSAVASDEARTEVYSRVWAEIEQRPIVGHGFQYIRGSHNIYMQVLHAGGIIALAALVTLVLGLLRIGLRTAGSGSQPGLTRAFLASAAVWLLVGGLFEPAIFDRYLYVPVGLLMAAWSVARVQTVRTRTTSSV